MTRRLLSVLLVATLLVCAGMGAGALEFDGEVVQLAGAQTGDVVWNKLNFGGFCYNPGDDACVGTETLTIAAYALEGPDTDRTIDEGCLVYTTSPTWREYELYRNLGLIVDGNSRYWLEFWMGGEYVAINCSANKPAKLLVEWDSTDIRTLATGEEWDLGGRFSLVAKQIDLDGDKVWFSLKKNGTELDDMVIDAGSSDLQDRVYTYTGNVSGVLDTPIFSCYVSAVFRGTCSNMVHVKHVFLIEDTVTGIHTGDDYGVMEVKTVSSSGITLMNDVPVDLTPNTNALIMGNLSFKTTNNTSAIEFYPHLIREEPPIHSGGGGFVLDDCRIDSPWNLSENYSIAAKDVSPGGDKARIVILKSGMVVGEALLTEKSKAPVGSDCYYSYVKNGTEIINATLKAAFRGHASNGVGLAEVHQRSEVDGSILITNESYVFKSADPTGIPWDLADGYVLAMKDVGFNGDEVWLELSKNGVVVGEEILNEDSASMFVYTPGTGSVTCMVDCIFSGCEANAVKLVNLSQYSDVNGTALIIDESHFYKSADPDGMAWELMDDYVLTMKDLEDQHGGDKVWLELSKDGIRCKEYMLESGDLFEYSNGLESVDCMVEAVFKGSLADVVKLKNVNQYSNTGMQLIENGSKTYATAYPTGDVWELCEDHSFVPKDIDMDGDKAWLSLLKDGVIVKDAIVDSGGDRWFEYHNATGALIFRAYLDAVFRGTDSNLIQLKYVSQYSEINGSALIMFEEGDKKTLSTPHKLPDIWTVDDSGGADFASIQAAIDAATSGNTIYVYAGTYSENVVVNKQLTLYGEGAEVVTVTNCTSDSPVFNVTADYVNISEFTVTGATGWGAHTGIYLSGVDHCTISSNNVLINRNGIYLYHSDNNTIIDNNASSSIGCGSGILVRSSDSNYIINNNASNNEYPGIYLVASDSNTIADNTLINNTACNYTYGGIELYFSSSSNTITNNTIIDNVGNGIRIWDSSNSNTLTNNSIESNNHYGVYLSSSSNNLVFHNNLVNNSNNAYDNNPTDNDWHHPVLLKGNYWSDYAGVDDGSGTGKHGIAGDGIGDTDVPHPAADFDLYPFMDGNSWHINKLHIQVQTDEIIYYLNEDVAISCTVQNEIGDITVDTVEAEILKPDSSVEWVTMTEELPGHYNGIFANTSLNGTYNVTIYADKTGYANDTAELWFNVLTSVDWWPMFGHDSRRTSYSSSEAPNTNHVLWTYETQGSVASSPAVVNDVAFVGSDDCNLYAINVNTGELIWKYVFGEDRCAAGHSSPAIADGKVFIGIGSTPLGVVYALNQTTGELIWSYTAGDGIDSSPVVADGKVFVNLWNTEVLALDATTGELIWSYDTGGSNRRSSPAVADGIVYVASYGGNLYALDADTGSVIWTSSIAGRALSPAIAYGKVFVSGSVHNTNDDGVCALNATTGEMIWSHNIGTWAESSPSVAYGKVFVGGENMVYAFNESTGEQLWGVAGDLNSRPAVADMKVFAGVSGSFCAFSERTGELVWSYPIGVDSSPAVADGKVFVGSGDHIFYCFYAYEHDVAVSELEVPFPVFPESLTEVNVSVYNSGLNDESGVAVQFLVDGSVVDSQIIPLLTSMSSTELIFSWTAPVTPNIYEFSVCVVPVIGETNTRDNTAYSVVTVGGKIIEVPGDYPTIQQAVDAADPGDTIQIASGTYYENVVIDKSHLALIGVDRDTSIIDGGEGSYVVHITADWVNIDGFHLKHSGGGIYGEGIIIFSSNNNITNCKISNNEQGILLHNSLNTITNCNIYSNDWHGITLWSSDNLITNCNISSNGQSEIYSGHGIYLDGATYNKIINCNISKNNDDGIHLGGASNNQIINCDIYSNNLVGIKLVEGYHGASSNNEITDCGVWNNENGIYFFESYDNVLRGNSILDNTYNFGVCARDTWRYNQDIDTSNTIDGKPIYYLMGGADLIIDGATSDVGYIGLISCDNVSVRNLNISQNYQGLMLVDTTNSMVENCDTSNNDGGIYLYYSSNNDISNSKVSANTCGIHFYGNGASNNITDCEILNNSEEGIYFDLNSGGSEVTNCTISNNGQGIRIDSWMANKITSCSISKNEVGIHAGNSFDQQIMNCIISDNDGDGVYLEATQHYSLINNIILDNGNRGIFCAGSPNTIANCIIWGNNDDLDGAGGTATYSDIGDGDPGEGNICAYPMFVNPAGGDYHLQSGSPCIDMGNNTGAPITDFDGNPRPIDGDGDGIAIVDMGTFEYLPPPPNHDIAVTNIDAPNFAEPDSTVSVNATISDLGLSNESNIIINFIVDGVNRSSIIIPFLVSGSSENVRFQWTPTTVGLYNLSVFAEPVCGENIIRNNHKEVRIWVSPNVRTIGTGILGMTGMGMNMSAGGGRSEVYTGIIPYQTYEFFDNVDLNGDGDTNDSVIMCYDVDDESKHVVDIGSRYFYDNYTIAYVVQETERVSEWEIGDQNGDGDTYDDFYMVNGDLNGDGDMLDAFLKHYDVKSGISEMVGEIPRHLWQQNVLLDNNIIIYTVPEIERLDEWEVGDRNGDGDLNDYYYNNLTDLNGDGDLLDVFLRYCDTKTGATKTIDNVSRDIWMQNMQVDDGIITYIVQETGGIDEWAVGDQNDDGDTNDRFWIRIDTNSDGDTTDTILRYYDVNAESLHTVGEINQCHPGYAWIILGNNTIIYTVSETQKIYEWYYGDQNGDGDTHDTFYKYVDSNGDGDFFDTLLMYHDIATGLDEIVAIVAREQQSIQLSDGIVAYTVLETLWLYEEDFGIDQNGDGDAHDSFYDHVDLNGDGDMFDTLLMYHDITTGLDEIVSIVTYGSHQQNIQVADGIIAYTVPETLRFHEGWFGIDQNGDGDTCDYFYEYADLNNDGDTFDTLLRYRDVTSGLDEDITADLSRYPHDRNMQLLNGVLIYPVSETIRLHEVDFGIDQNGDGDTHDTFWRFNGDFNGDGDMFDAAIWYYNINDSATTLVDVAASSYQSLGMWLDYGIVAYSIPEAQRIYEHDVGVDQNGDGDMWGMFYNYADYSGDGDTKDFIVRYLPIEQVSNVKIVQARTDKSIYCLNETVTISCVVQNETGCNIIADSVDAKILKPDRSIEWVTMTEGLLGHYNGTFTNTSMDGTYNVTIHADKTGYVNGTAEFWFEVSTSQVREFDTGSGTYPSIYGRHTGTIKPLHDVINISTMYTYPCAGTGGHSEYVRIFGNGVDVTGTWNGYSGDYPHITFPDQFTLLAGHTYNYTIKTGSYPQIHHTTILTTPGGEITCAEFVDANGKRYDDRIPAFRLE